MDRETIRLLLVEDNPSDVLLLQELIAAADPAHISLTAVDRLTTGLEWLVGGGFDITLLDLSLPDSQGVETLLRLQAAAPQMPVVVLTGLDDEALGIQLIQAGAEDYLVKGQVSDQVLLRSVRYAIERKRAEVALAEERALLTRRVAERTAQLSTANAELARSARLKDEFLATMSHELRTPLNAILGLSEALFGQSVGPLNERQLNSVRTIEESGRHLLALINDILDVSKIEAGRLDLQLGPVSIEEVCRASLQFVKQTALRKRIDVLFQIDQTPSIIRADARRLKQILVNLLSNAVKFTPERGQVGLRVSAEPAQDVIHFTVWDTGIGISIEDLPQLFKPFVQLDSSLARQYEGTGLGLVLVSRLAELHGGSVSVESDGVPGRGCRFTVSLPGRRNDQACKHLEPVEGGSDASLPSQGLPIPASSSTAAGRGCYPPRRESPLILLTEDNEANIQFLAECLTHAGYRLAVARNGLEAIERVKEDRPALVLMDIQIPELDGLEATRRIRAEAHLADLPILALTALAMPGDRERCLAAGANDYMSKPFRIKQLVSLIETYLNPAQDKEEANSRQRAF